ncbi:preprotein translocase subunit SecE [Bifidobacterium cuniculi]|uniref:Protein translocase subunit SecE n=1 Tax=Bifidobacterium cuniculi TaxID=1688 RepID=A0A087AWN1_9BIFI|nr:preprotein translocase subunit SecE [Bifidobacterium cuniculi]KFI63181.1 preprotein translocase subunit SecE [Bifidobacterium cuniculi]
MARKTDHGEEVIQPNVFMRIGLFFKQIIDELRKVVTPTGKQLFWWSLAAFIFVALLMVCVTAMDYGLGQLAFLIFG